jgi:alpha-beta hydrolase superfamily lysophospholipase
VPSYPFRFRFAVPPLLLRAVAFVCALVVLEAALSLFMPLGAGVGNERRHIALPLVWALDWALWVRPNLPANWKRWIPALVVVAGAFGLLNWALVVEGARRGAGWAGVGEWGWKCALSLSLMAHWSLLARGVGSGLRRVGVWPTTRVWISALAATVLLSPYAFTALNAHRVRSASPFEPDTVGLKFERVRFDSGGLPLAGWWIPADRPTNRCVVVAHGVSANAGAFMGLAPFLHRAGFNVFFFDFRGHGSSAGHSISFGWHESQDVRAACRYVREVRKQSKLALYGFSMGGAAVSLSFHPRWKGAPDAAAFDESVRGVVLDSTFSLFSPLVSDQLAAVPASARPGLIRVMSVFSRYEIGVGLDDIAPRRSIPRVAPRPLLVIHGDADTLIPLRQARDLESAAREPKSLWVVPGATHCLCRLVNPPVYEARVARWLQNTLS